MFILIKNIKRHMEERSRVKKVKRQWENYFKNGGVWI